MHLKGAVAALLLGVLSGLVARGQAPAPPVQNTSAATSAPAPNGPEMSTRDAPATFSTKVNLVMVPVVVRDSAGKAIGTLHKEDFQLFDKGKPQLITRFSMERAGEAAVRAEVAEDASLENSPESHAAVKAPPIAERFVLYLFDDVHTTTPDLIQARDAAIRHLTDSLDPTTRAAIFTTSGQGNLDFTDDRVELRNALLKLMARPNLSRPAEECPEMSYYEADLIVNKNDQTALQAAAAEVLSTCAPPPPTNDPASQKIAQQMAQSMAQSTASRVLNLGEHDSRLALTTLENAIRRLSAVPGDRTLIFVSAGFFMQDQLRQEETDLMDRAIRANVRISSLNARGLYVLIPGGDASTP